jgi:colanic acid biosynthesis glycosyl transferase WcaI
MPKDRYKQFLHESDVCLISLSADIPAETVPGKLPDIMAHGKPVILAADPRGDAAQIITDAQCGFCVKPGDAKTFARAVLDLHGSESLRKQMGENGRVYAQRHFSRAACTKQYEAVLIPAMRGVRHDSVKAR